MNLYTYIHIYIHIYIYKYMYIYIYIISYVSMRPIPSILFTTSTMQLPTPPPPFLPRPVAADTKRDGKVGEGADADSGRSNAVNRRAEKRFFRSDSTCVGVCGYAWDTWRRREGVGRGKREQEQERKGDRAKGGSVS